MVIKPRVLTPGPTALLPEAQLAHPAALAIQLDPQPFFQSNQPAADSLLGDEQSFGRSAEAPLAGEFHESGKLVGGEGGASHE